MHIQYGSQLFAMEQHVNLLGVKGTNKDSPGSNVKQLAKVVAGAVLAGELSLVSAISAGQIVKTHMKYNHVFGGIQVHYRSCKAHSYYKSSEWKAEKMIT
ncbi:3-hydroxy-3-methylglutaryl CoA reductase 2 [Artemisia annua]|uniref:3-hydroxy-3-methylglutaryl CoA reductase 2 n=1 Tax=Artemisia annua TaxID=35608 RepID=A0A2U1LZA3_ARTAN|nr:3-hydroxy-3-methylglutaryl CoA reductase 2 [Artemisia annua]